MLFPKGPLLAFSKRRPKKDFDAIHEDLSQIEELKNIHLSTNGFPRLEFDDLHKEIKLLGIKRSIIPLSGVLKIYGASQLVNAYLKFFEFHNEKFQSIESVFFRIPTKRMKLLMPLKRSLTHLEPLKTVLLQT